LTQMEALRTSIGLEAYAQRDPLVQYKSQAFDMFGNLLADVRAGVVSNMYRTRTTSQAAPAAQARQVRAQDTAVEEQAPEKKKRKKRRKRRRN
jgi:preprotein translocase subunit SecA